MRCEKGAEIKKGRCAAAAMWGGDVCGDDNDHTKTVLQGQRSSGSAKGAMFTKGERPGITFKIA